MDRYFSIWCSPRQRAANYFCLDLKRTYCCLRSWIRKKRQNYFINFQNDKVENPQIHFDDVKPKQNVDVNKISNLTQFVNYLRKKETEVSKPFLLEGKRSSLRMKWPTRCVPPIPSIISRIYTKWTFFCPTRNPIKCCK